MRLIMLRSILWVTTLLTLVFPLQPNKLEKSPLMYASTITLEGPEACPPGGCAAGQTLNLSSSFDLTTYQVGTNPNVQFCVYTPISWAAESLTFNTSGLLSNQLYTIWIQPMRNTTHRIPNTGWCGGIPSKYLFWGCT